MVGDGAQSMEDCPLLALTLALHLQGRAGADGARGMPGEPGVKVKAEPLSDAELPAPSEPVCFLGMSEFPRSPHKVALPTQDTIGKGGVRKGLGPHLGILSSS